MIGEKEFIGVLNIVMNRPGMFRIQKVEDIYIFINAEIIINKNSAIENWQGRFDEFVVKELAFPLSNFGWCSLIRLHSGSNSHSLELFKDLLVKFTSE